MEPIFCTKQRRIGVVCDFMLTVPKVRALHVFMYEVQWCWTQDRQLALDGWTERFVISL
jgi:alpha-D-ribose 1-methylphosphonate 5-triphosphate synthase subunit PhnL